MTTTKGIPDYLRIFMTDNQQLIVFFKSTYQYVFSIFQEYSVISGISRKPIRIGFALQATNQASHPCLSQ